MEKFQELRETANKKLRLADHMATSSYMLLHDPKILLSAVNTLYHSVYAAMSSVLEHERLFKRVPAFSDTFDSKFYVFKTKIVNKHKISTDSVKLLKDLYNLQLAHKRSSIEFSKNNSFVIASDNYELRSIDLKSLKNYLNKAKVFIRETSNITITNDKLFR